MRRELLQMTVLDSLMTLRQKDKARQNNKLKMKTNKVRRNMKV